MQMGIKHWPSSSYYNASTFPSLEKCIQAAPPLKALSKILTLDLRLDWQAVITKY